MSLVSMRSSVVILGLLAACGGSPSAPKTPGGEAGGDGSATAEPATGSIGVMDLAWGATEAQVQAAFPQATANPDGGLWSMGTADGIQALTMFKFGASGLEQVKIEWAEGFPNMKVCLESWAKVRALYDTKYAVASQSENGAAYWKTPAVDVTLACNPNESDAGVMSASITPPVAE